MTTDELAQQVRQAESWLHRASTMLAADQESSGRESLFLEVARRCNGEAHGILAELRDECLEPELPWTDQPKLVKLIVDVIRGFLKAAGSLKVTRLDETTCHVNDVAGIVGLVRIDLDSSERAGAFVPAGLALAELIEKYGITEDGRNLVKRDPEEGGDDGE